MLITERSDPLNVMNSVKGFEELFQTYVTRLEVSRTTMLSIFSTFVH
jgi:hypothetical protein